MSDTNRVDLRLKEETTAGTLASGAYEACPYTAASDLGLTPEYITSAEIRADRQVSERKLVSQSVGGGFDFELQTDGGADAFPIDILLKGALQTDSVSTPTGEGAWDTVNDLAGNGSTFSGTGLSSIVAGGESAVIVVENTTSGTGDGVYFVANGGASWAIAGTPTFTATGTTRVMALKTFANGVTPQTISIEKAYTDHTTPLYEYLSGMNVDTLSLTFGSKAIVTGSVGFVGTGHEYTTSRSASSGSATTSEGVFSSTNFGAIREGASSFGAGGVNFVTELSVDISNNLRERAALGSAAPVSIGTGQFNVSGSIKSYFDNKTQAEKVLNSTTTFSLGWHVDNGSSIVAVVVPNVKFTQGNPSVSGANDDVMLDLNWEAAGTTNGTIQIGVCNY